MAEETGTVTEATSNEGTESTVAESEAQAKTFGDYIGGDGALKEGWTSMLSEDFREDATLKQFKTLEGLAGSMVNTKKMVGKKQVVGEFANDDDKADFYRQLGVPDEEGGYDFKAPENMPEGVTYDDTADKWFANKAKELNLTKSQANELRKGFDSHMIEQNAVAQQSHNDSEEALLKEQDVELHKMYEGQEYDKAILGATKMADTLGLTDMLNASGLGANAQVIKNLYEASQSFGEDRLVAVKQANGDVTVSEAKDKLADIQSNPAYLNIEAPDHKQLVRQATKLFQTIHPS